MRARAFALVLALAAGCGASGAGDCAKDTDCKGARVCVAGQCVDPGAADLEPAALDGNSGADFAGADFAGAASIDLAGDLGSGDLSGASSADLARADLAHSDLAHSDLAHSDLAHSDLAHSDLAHSDLARADLAMPVAWGAPCDPTSACAAPAGESGACATAFGTPVCLHSCNALPDYGACESGRGICVPLGGGTKYCFGRCGDQAQLRCGAGTGCALVGRALYGNSNYPVGACVADCTAGGADGCAAPGSVCDPIRDRCVPAAGCGGCPPGTSCQASGSCDPPSPSPLYGACTAVNATCAGLLCYGDALSGTCARFCDSSAGGLQTCGGGGTCWTDIDVVPEAPDDAGVVTVNNGSFVAAGGRTVGLCVKGCVTSSDCPFAWHCAEINGRRGCLLGADPAPTITAGSQQPGDPCRSAGDCVSNNCILPSTAWHYGSCGRVSAAVACPAGTVADAAAPLLCHKTCSGTLGDECPASQVCDAIKGYCAIALCRSSDDCSLLARCNTQSAKCEGSPATTGGAIGAACAVDGDCLGGHCVQPSGSLWPGGYCSAPCLVRDDFTDTCPSASLCAPVNGTGFYVGVEGMCEALCDAGAVTRFGACRGGYKCSPFASDPRFGVCVSM